MGMSPAAACNREEKECQAFQSGSQAGKPDLHRQTAAGSRRDDVMAIQFRAWVLAIIAFAAAPVWAQQPAAPKHADWMTKNFDRLKDKSLGEIALPGTHDSGAYKLGDRKSPDRSTAEWIIGRAWNITKPWAITQRLNIKEQLDGGVRWLDMRTAWDGDDFYFYHALMGPKTRDMLRQVRAFIDEPGHDHELIVLEFCNWQGLGPKTPNPVWARLGTLILDELGRDNVYRRDLSAAAKSDAELIHTRLGDILKSGRSRVLIFFQGHTDHAPFAYDAVKAYGGSYANRADWTPVEADQKAKLAAHQPGKMFVLSWTVTANEEVISQDLTHRKDVAHPALDLERLTRGGQGAAMRAIADWPGREKINVVICDFFDSSPLVPLCCALNGVEP
jgi:hypothetical protein